MVVYTDGRIESYIRYLGFTIVSEFLYNNCWNREVFIRWQPFYSTPRAPPSRQVFTLGRIEIKNGKKNNNINKEEEKMRMEKVEFGIINFL